MIYGKFSISHFSFLIVHLRITGDPTVSSLSPLPFSPVPLDSVESEPKLIVNRVQFRPSI